MGEREREEEDTVQVHFKYVHLILAVADYAFSLCLRYIFFSITKTSYVWTDIRMISACRRLFNGALNLDY
jgi:hypothetical protein